MEKTATQLIQISHRDDRFCRHERIVLFCFGILLVTLLAIAAWLTPDPSGLGTHTQLGLPGCTMFSISGIRCPGCGMTTSWAYAMNGELVEAIQSNLGGVLLFFLSAATTPCLFWMAIAGRSFQSRLFAQVGTCALISAVSISIAEWLIRLAF